MFNSLHHKNLSRLAVAGTATLVSPATCGRGSIQHLISNSLMNQLTNLITPLQLSRDLYKSTIFLQNKANLKHLFESITAYEISGSVNFMLFFRQKNKAKQSQFKPNYRPKLALFFPKLALNLPAPRSSTSEVGCQSACPSEPEGRSRVKSVVEKLSLFTLKKSNKSAKSVINLFQNIIDKFF